MPFPLIRYIPLTHRWTDPMTHIEQHKMIQELVDYMRKMKRNDQAEFEMFLKRDKDDEDLDEHSVRRLQQMYESYVPARLRNW